MVEDNSNPGMPMDDDAWMELVKRSFKWEQGQEQAENAAPITRRMRIAAASVCAYLLSEGYKARGDSENYDLWFDRYQRYHRRAYQRNNPLVKSLGAEMP